MVQAKDVVIIGGGIAGCSVAYYLSRAGVKSTIIEREPEGVGTQASRYAEGGLNPLEGANLPGRLSPLAEQSFNLHLNLLEELPEETGIDYHFYDVHLIKVAFAEGDLPAIQESLDIFTRASGRFSACWLDQQELRQLEPRLNPQAIRGLYAQGNAALDNYLLTQAFAKAAEKSGAKVCAGKVQGLKIGADGRVDGVFLEDGSEVACGQVVLAMGPWSREAEPWLDISIPVDPLKGEMLRMDLPGPRSKYDLTGGGGSLHPKPDGLIWCGSTEEWRGFDKEPSDSARQSILQGAIKLMPDMAQAQVRRQTACLRPVTADWMPILGQAPGWENVYLATGAGKKGILLSPAIGKSIADLITRGSTELAVGDCAPDRFVNLPS